MRFYTPPPRMMESAIAAASTHRPHLDAVAPVPLSARRARRPAWMPTPQAIRPFRARPRVHARGDRARLAAARPAPDTPPRVYHLGRATRCGAGRAAGVGDVLWPKLTLIVAARLAPVDHGLKADLMLPAAGYYEKRGIKYAVALAPYVVVGEQAVPPLGEAKSEWEVMTCSRGASRSGRASAASRAGSRTSTSASPMDGTLRSPTTRSGGRRASCASRR